MAFYGFYDVLEIQESILAEGGPVDIGVYSLISSLEITASRLKGIKLVPRKLARIFSSPKIVKNAV